jgi:hypothetical protein
MADASYINKLQSERYQENKAFDRPSSISFASDASGCSGGQF